MSNFQINPIIRIADLFGLEIENLEESMHLFPFANALLLDFAEFKAELLKVNAKYMIQDSAIKDDIVQAVSDAFNVPRHKLFELDRHKLETQARSALITMFWINMDYTSRMIQLEFNCKRSIAFTSRRRVAQLYKFDFEFRDKMDKAIMQFNPDLFYRIVDEIVAADVKTVNEGKTIGRLKK